MLSRWETDRQFAAWAIALKAEAVTPQHSAAEAAVDAEDVEDAKRRRRERIQHEVDPVDPYLHDAPEAAHADLPKAYDQAVDVPEGYPPLRPVHAEQFRKRPVTASHAAYSPGYGPPGRAVPVPSATLAPGMVTRPLLAGGQSRPCAPEAC
jgi:hypothetical protein